MNKETNEISSSSMPTPLKLPIEVLNLTKSTEKWITANKNSALEHVTSTELRNVHDIYGHLGFGDCMLPENCQFPYINVKQGHFVHVYFPFPFVVSDAVTQTMICAIVVGSLLLLVIWCLFIRQIPNILRNTPTKYLARTLILCGVYTIVGSAALVSLIAYRAFVFCDSVCHFAFLLCAYQYFALVIDYAGGETNFIKNTRGTMVFNMQTPPLCCCLRLLIPTAVTKFVQSSFHCITLITFVFFLDNYFPTEKSSNIYE